MNYLKEITGKKETSEFDVVSFPLVQKKKYFGTLEKTRQMCRLFISRGGAFWGAHWWCIFRCPVTFYHNDITNAKQYADKALEYKFALPPEYVEALESNRPASR